MPQPTPQARLDPAVIADRRRRWKKPVGAGPRAGIWWLLWISLATFALLMVNSVYLVGIRVLGLSTGESYEDWFYMTMFLAHLVLGLVIILPVIVFGLLHMRRVHDHPNRRAVKAGYALFTASLIVLGTGLVLMRIEGVIDIRSPALRAAAWWLHVIVPLLVIWLFVLHRLAGRRLRWQIGFAWGGVAAVFAIIMLSLQSQDPRKWNVVGNPAGDAYFFPSLSRTVSGDFIPAKVLDNDEYCLNCHADIHGTWMHSVHRFSSFSNPVYLASVTETRQVAMDRDGNVAASRFCAGCHDPVPFFSGAFNDPDYDMLNDPTASAGITCTVCHGITHINSPRGNGDYTIDEPPHYPFTFSDDPFLQWVNQQLVKSKPEFHKKTFLKPLHRSDLFCGSCHKVHLPVELNHYKWLRGQDHLDTFRLSGVSGHGIGSFYYPPIAQVNCNTCHMPLMASTDFGAVRDASGELMVHDHMFPSANTAMPRLVDMPDPEEAIRKHQEFLEGVMRVDLFGIKPGGTIGGELIAPIGGDLLPELVPGGEYLVEAVVRTVKMGHVFTQGTSDSNQVWMDFEVRCGDEVIGRSGAMDDEGMVDPWSHFVNAFVIDRDGHRISRRNAQDIFTSLYNHQIPPGAADVVHYRFRVPDDCDQPVHITAVLKYRKFDTTLMRFVKADPAWVNDLPVTVLAEDAITLPIEGGTGGEGGDETVPEWIRWNDYGIALFRKGGAGELRGAEEAFARVEAFGRPDGPINLARVYLKEGRVTEDAPGALARAAAMEETPARAWHLLWFGGQVDRQNGRIDEAIAKYRQIVEGGFEQAAGRGFDFSEDWRVLNELASTLYQRARMARGEAHAGERAAYLLEAADVFEASLALDPEGMPAHFGLMQVLRDLGDEQGAARHEALHAIYKPDDNAKDHAIAEARKRYPAANRAAEAVVIHELNRASPPPPAGEVPRSPPRRSGDAS